MQYRGGLASSRLPRQDAHPARTPNRIEQAGRVRNRKLVSGKIQKGGSEARLENVPWFMSTGANRVCLHDESFK